MSQRTVAEARARLDQALPHLNEYWRGQYTSLLEESESRAKKQADETVAHREEEVLQLRDAALRELTAARDGFDDLARDGKSGRIPSTLYSTRIAELKAQQTAAEEQLGRADAIAESVERIEADPIAWFSEIQERTPRLKMEFPW